MHTDSDTQSGKERAPVCVSSSFIFHHATSHHHITNKNTLINVQRLNFMMQSYNVFILNLRLSPPHPIRTTYIVHRTCMSNWKCVNKWNDYFCMQCHAVVPVYFLQVTNYYVAMKHQIVLYKRIEPHIMRFHFNATRIVKSA